ncbi:four-carbon acid sugar kinase family protein [Candidatus Thiosymbion oneisti]|uniref:four-carbon acid sugar kinase family protein n=1 Tax=Candidatus Thiosymbion oneisti TaxID=589554 RepID=UPI000A839CCA|nr:four-carbon acid sugar kinase family protein [Candidatus Thiosymbion oneisti]
MPSGPDVAVIADDLTGAADTGVQFAAIGAPVYLMPVETLSLGRPWLATATGISVYTATRGLSASEAGKCVRLAARALPDPHPRWIYKKIDSCLRGNLGAEIDALLDTLGLDVALVAPALPVQGRTTIGGIQRVYGTPLAQTQFASDPLTPVTCSSVAEVLAHQSRYGIGRVDVDVYGDPGRLQRAVQRERERGCRLIVCDAAIQAHLDELAALVVQNKERLLPVGSAGLAASLVGQLASDRMVAPVSVSGLERLLMICGTGAQATREQLDVLLDKYPGVRHELAFEWLTRASARDRRRCAAELLDAWTGGVLVVTVRSLPSASPTPDLKRAAAGLGGLALEIMRAGPVDGLFLSGGETAAAVRRAAGGEAIELQREVLPGLVLGRWVGGIADGLPVVTKAGALGEKQALVVLYEHMSRGAGL